MATRTLRIAGRCDVVRLARRKVITAGTDGVTTGAVRDPGVVHGRRNPSAAYRVTCGAGVRRHGRYAMCLYTRGGSPCRTGAVMTGGAVTAGNAGMRERSGQPRRCQVATGALRVTGRRDVIGLGRGKPVA